MTANEGGVGDDTCLTLGRMCTCALSPSSAAVDLYFYGPFLPPKSHFEKMVNIYFPYQSHARLHHSSFPHTYLIAFFLQPLHLFCHRLLFYALLIPAPTCSPCSLATPAPPSRLRAALVPPTSGLRESIEILMAPAVKTAFHAIRRGSAAAPRQECELQERRRYCRGKWRRGGVKKMRKRTRECAHAYT